MRPKPLKTIDDAYGLVGRVFETDRQEELGYPSCVRFIVTAVEFNRGYDFDGGHIEELWIRCSHRDQFLNHSVVAVNDWLSTLVEVTP